MQEKAPNKGKQGGIYNRTACSHEDVEFFNHGTNAYYCDFCAARINQAARGEHYHPLCYKNTGPEKMKAATALQELAIQVKRQKDGSWEQRHLLTLYEAFKNFIHDEDKYYL